MVRWAANRRARDFVGEGVLFPGCSNQSVSCGIDCVSRCRNVILTIVYRGDWGDLDGMPVDENSNLDASLKRGVPMWSHDAGGVTFLAGLSDLNHHVRRYLDLSPSVKHVYLVLYETQ